MKPEHIIHSATFKANEALTDARRFVKMVSENKVEQCGAGEPSIGVMIEPVTEAGDLVRVALYGLVYIEVGSGGVTANKQVVSDDVGRAVDATAFDFVSGTTLASLGSADLSTVTEGGVTIDSVGSSGDIYADAELAVDPTKFSIDLIGSIVGKVAELTQGGALPQRILGTALETATTGYALIKIG